MSNDFRRESDANNSVRQAAAHWHARLRADNVSEQDHREFQAWLREDEANTRSFDRMNALWSEFANFRAAPEISDYLSAETGLSARPRGHRHALVRQRKSATRRHVGFTVAAILCAIFVIGGVLFRVRSLPSPIEYATKVGEQRTFVLDDGSRVALDTDSKVSISFSNDVRNVTLDHGRAFFWVAKDRDRPFLVSAGHGVVRAVGTEFDVFEHGDVVQVTLVEGRVVVTSAGNGNLDSPKSTVMTAGQRLLMGGPYRTPRIEPAHAGITPMWLTGKLAFNDTSLADAAREFNRYNTHHIVIADQRTAKIHVSGVFRSGESQAFTQALRTSYGISVELDSTGDLVLRSSSRAGSAKR